MSKLSRQKAILELLEEGPIASQEELQKLLHRRGFDAGQATLSRDIRELGLVTRDDWDELELRVSQLEHRLRLLEDDKP